MSPCRLASSLPPRSPVTCRRAGPLRSIPRKLYALSSRPLAEPRPFGSGWHAYFRPQALIVRSDSYTEYGPGQVGPKKYARFASRLGVCLGGPDQLVHYSTCMEIENPIFAVALPR